MLNLRVRDQTCLCRMHKLFSVIMTLEAKEQETADTLNNLKKKKINTPMRSGPYKIQSQLPVVSLACYKNSEGN